MAVTSGDFITASTVNSLNSSVTYSGTFVSGSRLENLVGNSGEFYSHRPSGSLLFSISGAATGFISDAVIVEKYVSGSWTSILTIGVSSNATSASCNSTGPGRYRARSFGSSIKQGNWYIYCGQTDVQVGQKIICWDGFQSSLNKVNTGSSVTAALGNAQRVGGES